MKSYFTVSWMRVNDREAMHGGTDRHGIEDDGLSLREAFDCVRRNTSSASESGGCYADSSDSDQARSISSVSEEWETRDTLTLAIHFPDSATPSSRARLVRLFTESRAFRL